MSETMLMEVQTALLEALPDTAPDTAAKPVAMPDILTDYLDTLLRSATEIPESRLESFPCLHFKAGQYDYLTPLSRVRRIDLASPLQRKFGVSLSGKEPSGRYMLLPEGYRRWLFFDSLHGLQRVQSDAVIWREAAERAPWFIGTHKELLCRLFDPKLLIERR